MNALSFFSMAQNVMIKQFGGQNVVEESCLTGSTMFGMPGDGAGANGTIAYILCGASTYITSASTYILCGTSTYIIQYVPKFSQSCIPACHISSFNISFSLMLETVC